jgi:MFS family permease
MELQYNYVLAFWLAGWVMIIWQIFLPSMRIIRELDDQNLVWRWRYMTFLLFGIMAFVCVPILMLPVLVDKYRQAFIYNYVRNLMKDNESKD